MLWIGVGIGFMIGGFIGMLVVSLGVITAREDQDQVRLLSRNDIIILHRDDPRICRSDDMKESRIYWSTDKCKDAGCESEPSPPASTVLPINH